PRVPRVPGQGRAHRPARRERHDQGRRPTLLTASLLPVEGPRRPLAGPARVGRRPAQGPVRPQRLEPRGMTEQDVPVEPPEDDPDPPNPDNDPVPEVPE